MNDLDHLDRLHAAATPGPWEAGCYCVDNGTTVVCDTDAMSGDMEAIAALHNAWPAISRELRALRKLGNACRSFLACAQDNYSEGVPDLHMNRIDEALQAADEARDGA